MQLFSVLLVLQYYYKLFSYSRIKFVKVEWLLECAVTCTHVEESRYSIDFEENSIQSTKDVRTTDVVTAACDEDDIMNLYFGVKSTEGKGLSLY